MVALHRKGKRWGAETASGLWDYPQIAAFLRGQARFLWIWGPRAALRRGTLVAYELVDSEVNARMPVRRERYADIRDCHHYGSDEQCTAEV